MKENYIVLDIETTGLNPVDNRITCICAKNQDTNFFKMANNDEFEILYEFFEWLEDVTKDFIIISKNGKMFDIPFIMTRASKFNMSDRGRFVLLDNPQIDLQEYTKGRVKLDDMATLLGIENKSANGLQAIEWFNKGKFKELADYCMKDVDVTEKCFIKMFEMGIVTIKEASEDLKE